MKFYHWKIKFGKIARYLFPFWVVGGLLWQCGKDLNDPNNYFTQSQKDSLVVNMITYVYSNAPEATDTTRWEAKFRPFYEKKMSSFHLEKFTKAANGWCYYLLVRPVGGSKFRRGVVGKFKLTEGSVMPINFEETVNTPHLPEEVVKERGAFLFNELVKNNNLDKYLPMKQYIEWPDASLVYDKHKHSWISTNKNI